MEKSPGTRTVSMFGGCWLTGIASGTSLINSSLALCRCLTYLQHSAVVVQVSPSLSLSEVPPLSFVQPTWISNKFSCILDHHSILYRSGFGRISISRSLVWLQMACLWIPLLAFFGWHFNICQALVQHWFTESHDGSPWGLHVSSWMFDLVRGFDLPVWLCLNLFVKRNAREDPRTWPRFLFSALVEVNVRHYSDPTTAWQTPEETCPIMQRVCGIRDLAFQILWLHRCNFFLC